MNFYSMRDLRTNTSTICENVQSNGEAIITNKGKPTLLVLDISKDDFELMLRSIRQAKAMIAFNNMRAITAENGYMSDEEIEAESLLPAGNAGKGCPYKKGVLRHSRPSGPEFPMAILARSISARFRQRDTRHSRPLVSCIL